MRADGRALIDRHCPVGDSRVMIARHCPMADDRWATAGR